MKRSGGYTPDFPVFSLSSLLLRKGRVTIILKLLMKLVFLFLRVEEKNSFPPPLSAEEERRAFAEMRAAPPPAIPEEDREARKERRERARAAREKLILHNMRLVAHIVKKYAANEKSAEDLISIGTIGLIKAIDSFNPENGTRFATYAGKCLQNEILMHFRSQKKSRCEVSIHDTIDVDKEGNPLTYMDIICCDDTIAEDVFTRIGSRKALDLIKSCLSDRERYIITRRYGLDNAEPVTQRELAEEMKISRSYVSRIEKFALNKLLNGMNLPSSGGE